MINVRLDIALFTVETAPYPSLNLQGLTYPHWIMSHVRQGMVTTDTGGESRSAHPGDVMIHPPGLPFSECASGPGVHQWVLFDAFISDPDNAFAPPDLLTRFPLPQVVTLGERAGRFSEIFTELEIVWQQEVPDELVVMSLAGRLLVEVIGAWRDSGSPTQPAIFQSSRSRFTELISFMERHLADHLNRDELAKRAFLHPGSFDRAFRSAHGIPPMRLLLDMRLARARRLLETTDDTLEAIARAVGLGDAPRLSRHFRSRYGIAPGAYRSQARSANSIQYIPTSR